jgi:glyoxylase-like metal-dependent hydrolase (beta-lactamase superfamily II)
MQEIFKTRLIADRIWSIDGPANDLMYLVEGNQKAMLVDTGMGIGDLFNEISAITNLPLIVVNTHGHPDHAGGNPNFSEVWLSSKDLSIMRSMCSDKYRVKDLKSFNEEQSHVYQSLIKMIPYKEVLIHSIYNGQIFDLGNRQFEVVEMPGHTPGCVGFLNKQEKIFFTGDTIVKTPVWLYLDHSLPFHVYLQTLHAVQDRENEFDTILPGHNPTPLGKEIFHQILQCAEEIHNHRGIGELTATFAGEGHLWRFEDASIIYNPENW